MKYIDVTGDGLDIEYATLTKEQATEILSHGITQDDIDDFLDAGSSESGVVRGEVVVGAKAVHSFDAASLAESEPFDLLGKGTKTKWLLIKEEWQRGIFRRVGFSGRFDTTKLEVNLDNNTLRGRIYKFASVSYDGDEGEFGGTDVVSQRIFLLNPKGEEFSVDVCDTEQPSDVGISSTATSDGQGYRIYKFSNEDCLIKFKEWIASDVQSDIDDGITDIKSIEYDSKALTAIMTGNARDISFMPNPSIGWAQEDFGDFTIEDHPLDV